MQKNSNKLFNEMDVVMGMEKSINVKQAIYRIYHEALNFNCNTKNYFSWFNPYSLTIFTILQTKYTYISSLNYPIRNGLNIDGK